MSRSFVISKDFAFSASHVLAGLPDDHPCSRLHGHNYVVRAHIGADLLDAVGFVVDYRALGGFKHWLDERFDHQHLNDRLSGNPTSELFCLHLYRELNERVRALRDDIDIAVSVSETPKSWAKYDPQGIV